MVATALKLTRVHQLFEHVKVYLFGQPLNWSGASQLLDSEAPLAEQLTEVVRKAGANAVWLPKASTFNARICFLDEFTHGFLPRSYKLNGKVRLITGAVADGLILPIGSAFGIASGDCPTVIVADPKTGKTIPAHAGRDCLIDRHRTLTQERGREHQSVIDAMVDAMVQKPFRPAETRRLQVFICGGIGPTFNTHPWRHPLWGEQNRKLTDYVVKEFGRECLVGPPEDGRLDLPAIIRAQLARYDIPLENIKHDGVDTYSERNARGGWRWWSHRRWVNNGKRGPDGRNLVLVVRHLF